MRHLSAGLLVLFVVFVPMVYISIVEPSQDDIVKEKVVKLGEIEKEDKHKTEIMGVWGDVFKPKMIAERMGYDLVAVSTFVNPFSTGKIKDKFSKQDCPTIHKLKDQRVGYVLVNKGDVVPLTPVAISAILNSNKDDEDICNTTRGIFDMYNIAKMSLQCFYKSGKTECKGDPIESSFWPVQDNSSMSDNGVQVLSMFPLFDPKIIVSGVKLSPDEINKHLEGALSSAVERMISRMLEEKMFNLRSVAFPALGATDREADSNLFLSFSQGFLTIAKALESKSVPRTLDKVYLVAYDKHSGSYKDKALEGLQDVFWYFKAKYMFRGKGYWYVSAMQLVLFVILSVMFHSGEKVKTLIERTAIPTGLAAGGTSGLLMAMDVASPFMMIFIYIMFTVAGVLLFCVQDVKIGRTR